MSNNRFRTTLQKNGEWAVKREGEKKTSAIFNTQSDAWCDARRRARGAEGEALLEDKNGKVLSRNTYM